MDTNLEKFKQEVDEGGRYWMGSWYWDRFRGWLMNYKRETDGTTLTATFAANSKTFSEWLAKNVNLLYPNSVHVTQRNGKWCVARDTEYFPG